MYPENFREHNATHSNKNPYECTNWGKVSEKNIVQAKNSFTEKINRNWKVPNVVLAEKHLHINPIQDIIHAQDRKWNSRHSNAVRVKKHLPFPQSQEIIHGQNMKWYLRTFHCSIARVRKYLHPIPSQEPSHEIEHEPKYWSWIWT